MTQFEWIVIFIVKRLIFLYIFSINSSAAQLSKNGQLDHLLYFWLPRRCESMFSIVLENLNVVGVWYTYDQIILSGMDWLLCAFHNFSDHLFLIIREPGYWYQQPLSDYKKCQTAVCSSVAYGTYWDPQWQPDTTGVVITTLQQIHIDNRGQPACRSLMGLGWGCPIDCELWGWTMGILSELWTSECEISKLHCTVRIWFMKWL